MDSLDILSSLNGWDYLVIFVIFCSSILSLARGFSREFMSLLSWIAAFILSNIYAGIIANSFLTVVENLMARLIISWIGLFVLVLIVGGFLAKALSKLVNLSGLGLLDRLTGIIFGFARGIIVVAVATFLVRELVPGKFNSISADSTLVQSSELVVDWSAELVDFDIDKILQKEVVSAD